MNTLQQKVTEKNIAMLEKGVKPWVCPWNEDSNLAIPNNLLTGNKYSGINIIILWQAALEGGFTSSKWLTCKQANQLKGHVRKGEKGAQCFYYSLKELEDQETHLVKRIPMLKSFTLFNLSQIEGIKEEDIHGDKLDVENTFESNKIAENLILASHAKIKFLGFRACYHRQDDIIYLPEKKSFKSSSFYYNVALHELTHWTGHESRLNREARRSYGDNAYAFEELVAEMGSAFLCADLGVQGELQHDSYIESWLQVLRRDIKAIFTAASLASKAHAYLSQFALCPQEVERLAS